MLRLGNRSAVTQGESTGQRLGLRNRCQLQSLGNADRNEIAPMSKIFLDRMLFQPRSKARTEEKTEEQETYIVFVVVFVYL